MTRSKRLAVHTSAAATWETIYTTPSGKVTLLKYLAWFAGHSPDTGVLYFSLKPAGTSDFYIFFKQGSLLSGTTGDLAPWIVLEEGDAVQTFSTYTDTRVQLHGAELTAG